MLSIGVVVMKLCGPDKYSLLIVLFQTPVGIAVSARMLILFVSVYVCDLCVRWFLALDWSTVEHSCWFTCCQSQWAQVNLRPAIKTGKVTGNQRECPFSANQKHWKWRHRTHTQTPHKARCCSWISWQTIIALHPQSSVFVMSGRHFSRLTFRQLTRNDISGHYLHDYLQMRMHLKPKSCHAYNHPKNCTAYAYNHPKNCTASAYNHPKNGTANVSQSQRWIFCKLNNPDCDHISGIL